MNCDDTLLRGRKEICAFLKVSWQTVRRWQRFGLPIRRLPNGKPLMLKHEFIQWIVLLDEKADKGAAKGLQRGCKGAAKGLQKGSKRVPKGCLKRFQNGFKWRLANDIE